MNEAELTDCDMRSLHPFVIVAVAWAISGSSAWQGKSTIAASQPLHGLAFALKYLPVTVAEVRPWTHSFDPMVF